MQKLAEFFQTAPLDGTRAGQLLWVIILLPLLGALVCGVFGKIIGRANTHLVALGSVTGSFLVSFLVFWTINDGSVSAATPFGSVNYAVGADFGTWFSAGGFKVTFGLMVDHLSGSMLLVITGVGLLIHLYSTEYMAHDDGYWRFFAYLNLFVAAMLTLVMGDSLPLLFVGWEGVGLCSYLLIGFWYTDPAKAFAGRKAFITNRIGDFGFLVASFLMVLTLEAVQRLPADRLMGLNRPGLEGTSAVARLSDAMQAKGPLAFSVLEEGSKLLPELLEQEIPEGPLKGFHFGAVVTAALLLFLLGAAGKSAQIPLYVWLPDAMAGPTPVSALIHAATMVTSGVYLFCRISWLLVLSPNAMAVTALIGGTTALVAALIAFTQKGLKKVLAYSTVSQLGLMFLGLGAGAFWAAFLHVVTHAFFKACLFLGAGSVMHGNDDEEDITKLGHLRKDMPITTATFLVATLAITGVLPLSGFFSKDAILHAAHTNSIPQLAWALQLGWVLGVITAGCTAFYMFRVYLVAFEYPRSADAKSRHAHESGWAMTLPLVLLAVFSVLTLVHGLPVMKAEGRGTIQTLMENFLDPVFRTTQENVARTRFIVIPPEEHVPWGAYLQAWVIALLGAGSAFFVYLRVFPARNGRPLTGPLEALRSFSFHKFYVDEVYQVGLIRPLSAVSRVLWRVVDSVIIDGLFVRGTGWVVTRTGAVLRYLQSGDAQSYAAVMVLGLASALVWILSR